MTCEVRNKEINNQCAELLVRPLYVMNSESRTKCHKSDMDKMPQNENRTKCQRIRIHQNCNNKSYNNVTKV